MQTPTIAATSGVTTTTVRCRHPRDIEEEARRAVIAQRKWDKRLIFLAGTSLAVGACVAPTVTTQSAGCSSLIPPSWEQGVAGAPLPEGNTVADWIVFGDAQTGKLDQANSRTKDAIEIQRRCEERDAKAVKKATRGRFLGIF